MSNTVVSPLVHSPNEHSIAAMPDSRSVQKIVLIQKQLKSLLGDAIWLTPPNALHITLMEIICDTEYRGVSRQEHFMGWYKQYNAAVRETIARFKPIVATFNELHASQAAIIIKITDPTPFNTIREELLASTVLPAQTKMPPDIAHCTIARYSREVDLDIVRERTSALSANFDISIGEFKLMKDLGPDFHPTDLQTYSLKA